MVLQREGGVPVYTFCLLFLFSEIAGAEYTNFIYLYVFAV